MKTFMINSRRGVVSQKKKRDISSILTGHDWRILTDEPSVTAKYIFKSCDTHPHVLNTVLRT